jgi:hypothetical protein
MTTITISSADIKNLVKVMRAAGPDLLKEMRREVRAAAQPVIRDMQREIMADGSWPASSTTGEMSGVPGAGGIRGKIANSTRLTVSGKGVRIFCSAGSLGSAQVIPAYVDAGQPWRHPVFGNRKAWVTQSSPSVGWFSKTGIEHHPQIKRDVTEMLVRYANRLAARL